MKNALCSFLAFLSSTFRSRLSMQMEILSLRHQLAIYQKSVNRPRIKPTDRIFWVWLSTLWSSWHKVLIFVKPETVIAWQHKRFRDHWRKLSDCHGPGHPVVSTNIVHVVFIDVLAKLYHAILGT